jgi:cysteinyl-tRNA synthetase
MRIYNSLTDKKEFLKKPLFRKLKLFVCGPTVYDAPHIGNLRTFMSFDIIVRYLRNRGLKLVYLQNITDVDDKIIAKAKQENASWDSISRKYEKMFLDYTKILGIDSVDRYARATDYIPAIIKQISTLIEKDCAYKIDGDGWYFDLSRFPEYGKLSHRTTAQAEDGVSRIDASEKKRNAGDFCLWKFTSEEDAEWEPSWHASIGRGRPGWHIEDTAITESFFGPQYDIHGGGIDLKFPHHDAEIAQQESASGKKPFVKIWMHTGFLKVRGQKMSKSLGNFVSVEEILSKMSPDEFRFMVFQQHYRTPLDFSDEAVAYVKTNFSQISEFTEKLAFVSKKGTGASNAETRSLCKKFEKEFIRAMDDDFNSPEAIAVIHTFINEVNEKNVFSLSPSDATYMRNTLRRVMKMVGFEFPEHIIPPEIAQYMDERELSRSHKQFIRADALREKINALGYTIEDTPLGPLVRKSVK